MSKILLIFKMAINLTLHLPVIEKNGNRQITNLKLCKFVYELCQLGQHDKLISCHREYNPIDRELILRYIIMSNFRGITVKLTNHPQSSMLTIIYFQSETKTVPEVHQFNSDTFLGLVSPLLREEDHRKQREFDEKKQECENALKNAHESTPQRCGGVSNCTHCKNEERIRIHNQEILRNIANQNQYGSNWQRVVGFGYT